MSDNQTITAILCILAITFAVTMSIFNLKEERLEKFYIEQGYQQVFIGNNKIWQKVKQPEAQEVK